MTLHDPYNSRSQYVRLFSALEIVTTGLSIVAQEQTLDRLSHLNQSCSSQHNVAPLTLLPTPFPFLPSPSRSLTITSHASPLAFYVIRDISVHMHTSSTKLNEF